MSLSKKKLDNNDRRKTFKMFVITFESNIINIKPLISCKHLSKPIVA